ncbi:uncharacterized protein LOC116841223 isoform X1 [Odontomachus brunneus]|uniref:uncharacterized protein LOC116841223 isoform X1 n=1 Tax=Odontomachus brunneus TaxID=486640 RepID=UPI0013F2509C|nr:uncharacterized protein LOC116841223 isoform X1 [Odontomachus brunneus]
MYDDDDDRAAGTAEVTRGGGGCSPGTEQWYRGSREDVAGEGGRKIARRSGRTHRPRLLAPDGLAVVGPMEHDGLTTRVVMPRVAGTLATRSLPLLAALAMLLVALLSCCARASEFPERECCDLIFPIPEPTGRSTSAPTPTGRSGSGIKVPMAILNCLYARQLCFEDPSCSAILEIIPRVCGPELVACSTVTVTKCQAALRTLQAFTFFRPTCLCREPHVDPDCNSFQNFLFDHPCVYVLNKKDKDQFSIDALPTCNHALNVCGRDKVCAQIYKEFKTNCKIQEGKCNMENRDACHESWTQLRLSPMFGCICPNNSNRRRCDKIFSAVNHNPCVEFLPSSTSVDLSGTDSALYPFDPQQENYQEIWLPPTSMYPYFLFPGTARTPPYYDPESTYDIREPGEQHRHRHGHRHRHQEAPELPGRPAVLVVEAYDPRSDSDRYDTDMNRFEDRLATSRPAVNHPDRSTDGSSSSFSFSSSSSSSSFSSSSSSSSSSLSKHDRASSTVHLPPQSEHDAHPHQYRHHHHHHQQHQHQHHRQHPALPAPPSVVATLSSSSAGSYAPAAARPTPTVQDEPLGPGHAEAPRLPAQRKFAPRPTYEHRAIFDRADDDLDDLDEFKIGALPVDRLFDLRETFEEFVGQVKVIAHPDNSTSLEVIESQLENPLIDADHQDLLAMKQLPIPGGHHHRSHHKRNQTDDFEQSAVPSSTSDIDRLQQPVKLTLSSTCHHAYTSCKNDPECKELLQPILNHCDSATCARNECMEALQHFYRTAHHKHSVEIAFCLCRKTDGKKDECIVAQEKMHPACVQRVDGAEMPTCHSLAETCKENKGCRLRLEYYEQNCAVDSVTKKCAGPTSECRKAMLGILGTELRTNCACKGTELTQLYDCLGWQRLLWVNPCVVESQKDYHARRKHHHPRTTTTTTTTTTTATTAVAPTTRSPASTTATTAVEQVEDNQIPEVTRWPTTEPTETWEITTTTISTTPSTTTTTTTPPRFCVVQKPRQSHQYIREGKAKRLYREDEPECSELCQCEEPLTLICHTICVDLSPCKTDFAFYNHEAPAYQAHRGPCLCYSGGFICMRPAPDTYSIPHGVFMFLGYSEKDEILLKQHNNLTVLDAVSSLDNFMKQEVDNQTVCTLFLYNATRENVIAVVRLGTDNPPLNSSQAQSLQHLLRVKEECASMMQDLSDKINNKHHEVHTHPLLSIFKMAEVEVKMPYSNEAITRSPSGLLVVLLAIGLLGSSCLFGS